MPNRSLPLLTTCLVSLAVGASFDACGAEPKLIFRCDVEEHAVKPDVFPPYDYLAVSDDGQTLAAASIRGGLAVWNLPAAKPALTLEPFAPDTRVNTLEWDLAFLPNEKKLAAVRIHLPANERRPPSLKLQVWDAVAGKKLNEFTAPQPDSDPRGLPPFVTRPEVAVSNDGKVVAASWSAAPLPYDFMKVQAKGINFPGLQMPKLGRGVTVVAWDLAKKQEHEQVRVGFGYAPIALTRADSKIVTWDGDERRIVLGEGDKRTILGDFSNRKWFGQIFKLAYSADGSRLSMLYSVGKVDPVKGSYSSNDDDLLRLTQFNTSDGEVAAESEDLPMFGRIAAINERATRYASAADKNTVRVYDAATNKEMSVVKPVMFDETDKLMRLAFDRTGRYLAASTHWGCISVWDLGESPSAEKGRVPR